MSSKYSEVRIEDLIDEIAMGPFGSNIKAECFISHGVPVFNGSNLTGYTTNDDNLRFVSPEKAASLGNALASRGDVVVTHRGTLGQISYIPYDSQYEHYIISQSQFRVRCNKKVLPQYLVSYFHTREGQWKLLSNKTQTGVPALGRPTTSFRKLNIPLPPMETQRKIVKIVDSIREKIALNSRTNGYLAAQEPPPSKRRSHRT
ncbi:restriction endonuclease, S subunit [Bifidobacterium boum]|uniref:Restriction endonuclease, S subunit n=3 Tax=Bifidobacterium boum TaxID=78343 RepID=A0A086ZF97_9BIFI|nr:restriction endonuclease, S subunit [Bifidobacterium boum]